MRENTKWVFYILAFAFVGWMVFDVGMGITGQGQYGTSDVVLKVDGEKVRITEYQTRLSNAYEQYRQQQGAAPLTREDEQDIQDQVVDAFIRDLLLRREYRRLGIHVTDAEIIELARTQPLPELLQHPDLQTEGRFDPEKYQRLLSSTTDPQLLQYIEARYRELVPQFKLAQYLSADVYVSDAKLWRIWRDQHDSLTAAVVAIRPEQIPDNAVTVSDEAIERYYREHRAEFEQPAAAWVSFVAQPRYADASDSAAARARIDAIRAEVARGGRDAFATAARRESADSGSAVNGGDLGWFSRTDPPFVREFSDAVKALRQGQLSAPVRTQFGWHLIQLTGATRDSLRASHILVPIELQGAHRDYVEARADTLDRIAAEQTSGAALDSAARQMNLPLAPSYRVTEGERLQLGRYLIADVGVWAFEAQVGETSPVIEAEPAFYVFRLDSVMPAGTPPLAAIREQVAARARVEAKRVAARARADSALAALRGQSGLAPAAAARGLTAATVGPFTRITPPPALSGEPLALGAAFGLRVGERSGVVVGERGFYIIESLARRAADSTAWAAQRDAQRESLLERARQARMQLYIQDLRDRATIVDRRKELYRTNAQAADATS